MLTEIATGLTALDGLFKSGKAVGDLIRSFGKPGDREIELKGLVSDMMDAGLQAKEVVLTLQGEVAALEQNIRELEEENTRLRKFEVDREKFELRAIAPQSFAYAEKREARADQPSPYLCAACFEKSERSILQLSKYELNTDILQCSRCDALVRCSHDRNRGGSVWVSPSPRRSVFDV